MYSFKIKSIYPLIIILGIFSFCQISVAEKKQSNEAPKILILGDSLSAEYGIPRNAGWVSHIQKKITSNQYPHQIINSSISGETTIGGLQRVEALLKESNPQIVILELGANDALRGLSLEQTKTNLEKITLTSKKSGAKVLILGMKIPPNYGKDYSQKFENLFLELGKKHGAIVVPFFLEKIATDPEMFQNDRIHPNEKAQPILANTVWPSLQKLLK
jgi:acyl-CoA thioesterase-1